MKLVTIFTPRDVVSLAVLWFGVFVLLANIHHEGSSVWVTAVGFSFVVLVPGILTAGLLRLQALSLTMWLTAVVGISLIELYALLLFTNTALPYLGVLEPLRGPVLGVTGSYGFLLLCLLYLWRGPTIRVPIEKLLQSPKLKNFVTAFLPSIFVLSAAVGALALNTSGSGIIAFLTLVAIAQYMVFLFSVQTDNEDVIVVALYFISLALLFMTSLRGEFIIGHDIQREFAVFELTKYHALWSIDFYHDAYNACLSITMLPTLMSNWLAIPDQYIYKVLFQILFATVPGMIYMITRRYVVKEIALVTTFFFFSFTTFYTDMPFLIRQEIAFIFLALMFLTLFGVVSIRGKSFILPGLFGLGMVLSHYSTTYTVIAIFLFAFVARKIMDIFLPLLRGSTVFHRSGINEINFLGKPPVRYVTMSLVLFLVTIGFVWSSLITDTSANGLSRVVKNTIVSIQTSSWSGKYSGDVKYNPFSTQDNSGEVLLKKFQDKTVTEARTSAPANTYYDTSVYAKYPIVIVKQGTPPLTLIGRTLSKTGINVPALHVTSKQFFAQALQILIVIGFLGVLFTPRHLTKLFDADFVFLSVGNLLMVAMIVVLPLLSIEYGVLRAFQQSLMFLGLFAALGILVVCFKCKPATSNRILLGCVLVFFLSSTGVIGWMTGGAEAPLTLNNDGLYYDQFYLRKGEVDGLVWLAHETAGKNVDIQSESQIDPHVFTEMSKITDANPLNNIYPELIRKDSYVFLNYTNLQKRQATVVINDVYVTYSYPIEFLDSVKTRVYDNGVVRIYK